MVTVVQLVRASDCGSECRGFESHQSPSSNPSQLRVVRDFLFSHSPPAFLLFLSFVDSSSAQCASCNEMPVRVAAFVSRPRLLVASALPVVPRLLDCSPFFGAACACAHERRARVGDIGVNLSARSHREIREPTKTCSLSRDLSALRAAAVLRFPPVNEFAPRARIYTRVRRFSFFAFTPSPCGTLGWLLIV